MMEKKEEIMAPRPLDILCGRGRASHFHSGNVFFRSVVVCHLPKYSSLDTPRSQKADIVLSVIQECFRQGSRFVKKRKGDKGYIELSLPEVKLKVGHALRDACSDMTKSLEPLDNPKLKSNLAEKSVLQAKMLEPRMINPNEFDRINEAKQRGNNKRSRKGIDNRNKLTAFLPSRRPNEQAMFVPSSAPLESHDHHLSLATKNQSNDVDSKNFSCVPPTINELATATVAMPPMTSFSYDSEDSFIKISDQQQEKPASLPTSMGNLSPETQRQIQLLHTNGHTFTTLLELLSDAQELTEL